MKTLQEVAEEAFLRELNRQIMTNSGSATLDTHSLRCNVEAELDIPQLIRCVLAAVFNAKCPPGRRKKEKVDG